MRRHAVVLLLLVMAGAGCARGIGPRSLPVDRTAYIDALSNSWTEQLLYNLVKLRYGDAPTFLDVSSISQSYQLETGASAGYEHGWGFTIGPGDVTPTTISTPRNVLKLGVSGRYQTNPTITYAPVTGEVIKNAFIKPINTTDLFRALATGWEAEFVFLYCVQSINNLQNKPENGKFLELVETWQRLKEKDAIHITFEEVKAKKEAAKPGDKISKEGKGANKSPDKLDKLADNLVEFTDNLVNKQKEKNEGEGKTAAAFITLNKDRAPKDVENFKKLLGYDGAKKLEPKMLKNAKTFLGKEAQNLTSKDEKILELKVVTSKDIPLEKGKHKATIGDEKALEKYQVVSEIPSNEQDLTKIYVRPRSVLQVLMLLSEFIDVPPSHGEGHWVHLVKKDKDGKRKWFPGFDRIKIFSSKDIIIEPDSISKANYFASVKYKGHWFYILNDDLTTKDIFSSLVGIFIMMEPGKKETPQLTLPVR
jgi:hypothetical protein